MFQSEGSDHMVDCLVCLLRRDQLFPLVLGQKVTGLEQRQLPLLYSRWFWLYHRSFGKRGRKVAGGLTKIMCEQVAHMECGQYTCR